MAKYNVEVDEKTGILSGSRVDEDLSLGGAFFALVVVGAIAWLGWQYMLSFSDVSYKPKSLSEAVEIIADEGYCTVSLDHEKCNTLFDNEHYISDGIHMYLYRSGGSMKFDVKGGNVYWENVKHDEHYQLPIDEFLSTMQ